MAAANNEFFEALSMLEHERGITAEYLIEKDQGCDHHCRQEEL